MINKKINLILAFIFLVGTLNLVSAGNYQFQNKSGTDLMVVYGANGNVSIRNHLLAGGFINSSTDLCTTNGICLTSLNTSLGLINNSLNSNYVPYTGASANVDLGVYNLTTTGKVGIGTTTPTANLHIQGSSDAILNLWGASTSKNGIISFGDTSERSRITAGYGTGGGGDITFSTDTTGGTLLDRMYIGNDGNVGIGTTSPANPLHIYHATTNVVGQFQSGDPNVWLSLRDNNSGSYGALIGAEGDDFIIAPNNIEKMRITYDGKVGIGTTSPQEKLEVKGNIQLSGVSNPSINLTSSYSPEYSTKLSANADYSNPFTLSGYFFNPILKQRIGSTILSFYTSGVEKLTINGSNVGIGTTSPSAKLEVKGTGNSSFVIKAVSSADTTLGGIYQDSAGAGNLYLYNSTGSANILLDTDGNSYINGGNVSIGSTSSINKLSIYEPTNINPSASATGQFAINGLGYSTYIAMNGTASYLGHNSGTRALTFQTDETDRMTILGTGNVGVGTTSPAVDFEVSKATTGEVRASASDSPATYYAELYGNYNSADLGGVRTSQGNLIRYASDNSATYVGTGDAVTIKSGKVGIGTANPQTTLEVNGRIFLTGTGTAPTSGTGVYMNYNTASDVANIQAYNYSSGTGKDLALQAVTGNVGIGTTSPSYKLTVGSGSTDDFIQIRSGSTNLGGIMFSDTNDTTNQGAIRYNHSNNQLYFRTNNAENMVITSTGNVGIGTTNPSQKLDVQGSINVGNPSELSNGIIFNEGGGDTDFWIARNDTDGNAGSDNDLFQIGKGTTIGASPYFAINSVGNVGIGTTTPTANLHIQGANDAILNLWGGSTSKDGIISFGDSSERSRITAGYGSGGGGDITFSTDTTGGTLLDRMYISNGGNVGIGTTSPTEKLEVEGKILANGTRPVVIDGSSTGSISKQGSAGGWAFGYEFKGSAGTNLGGFGAYGTDDTLNRFYIGTYNTNERVTILNNGKVGIGTTSPFGKLHIQTLTANNNALTFEASSQTTRTYGIGIDTSSNLAIYDNGASGGTRLVIAPATGNVGIGTSTPWSKLSYGSGGTVGTASKMLALGETSTGTYFYGIGLTGATNLEGLGLWGGTEGITPNSTNPHVFIQRNGGNVGIGTTTPQNTLNVVGNANITGTLYTGNADFNGGWTNNGVSIINGNVYAKAAYFYNITGLDVNTLRINGSLLPATGFDNTFDIGNSSLRWRNLYLSGDANVSGGDIIGANGKSIDIGEQTSTAITFKGTEDAVLKLDGGYTEFIVPSLFQLNNGLYVSGGTSYFQSGIIARGGISDDGGTLDMDDDVNIGNGALFVNNSLNYVGIGTTSPGAKLDVKGTIVGNDSLILSGTSGYKGIYFNSNGNGSARYGRILKNYDAPYDLLLQASSSESEAPIIFNLSYDTEAMRISSTGNVGIGTTSPSDKLEVVGNVEITSGDLKFNGSGTSLTAIDNYGGDANGIGIAIGSGAATIVGSGESASVGSANLAASTETLWLTSDQKTTSEAIRFITSLQDGWATRVDAMTILGNGNVGIGTITPAYKLDVNGTIRVLNAGGTTLRSAGQNNDTTLLRVDATNGETDSANYGFSLKYMGARSGNDNTLSLFSDNQAGSPVEAVTIQQNGNVGIGAISPEGKFHINSNVASSFPATSGTAQTGLIERLQTSGSNAVLDLGGNGGSGMWMQVTARTDLGAKYPLLLNPNGGNVGINTTSPQNTLNVIGSANITGSMIIGNSNITTLANGDVNVW